MCTSTHHWVQRWHLSNQPAEYFPGLWTRRMMVKDGRGRSRRLVRMHLNHHEPDKHLESWRENTAPRCLFPSFSLPFRFHSIPFVCVPWWDRVRSTEYGSDMDLYSGCRYVYRREVDAPRWGHATDDRPSIIVYKAQVGIRPLPVLHPSTSVLQISRRWGWTRCKQDFRGATKLSAALTSFSISGLGYPLGHVIYSSYLSWPQPHLPFLSSTCNFTSTTTSLLSILY